MFVFIDKYKYWRADHNKAATQLTNTTSAEEDSDTSEVWLEQVKPKYTTGTSKAWSPKAIGAFNNLCGSILSQRSLEGYGEVLELVKKRWFQIHNVGNRRKRRATGEIVGMPRQLRRQQSEKSLNIKLTFIELNPFDVFIL